MEMTTTKTVVVFAIIFGCFAVLYPKIFHPMVLHIFGFGSQNAANNDILSKIPPHLRKGPGPARVVQEDITRHVRDEHPGSFRPGPHPGLRAAAEMKKQAAATTGTGKGMMGVVLPMYAVGIVIYLIYTLTKVFGTKDEEKKDDVLSNNPFSEVQYDAQKKEFKYSDGQEDSEDEREMSKPKKHQRDLERLLLRADEHNISYKHLCDQILSQSATAVATEGQTLLTGLSSGLADLGAMSTGRSGKSGRGRDDSYFMPLPPFRVYRPKTKAEIEMRQLKARLLETEEQMSRILKAMETVTDKVNAKDGGEAVEDVEQEAVGATQRKACKLDSSPDMETYDIIEGTDRAGSQLGSRGQTIEDVGPEVVMANTPHQGECSEAPQEETLGEEPAGVAAETPREEEENVTGADSTDLTPGGDGKSNEAPETQPGISEEEKKPATPEQPDLPSAPVTNGIESSSAPVLTEERIPEKKPETPQEPRPDLRKRKQGKRARREN